MWLLLIIKDIKIDGRLLTHGSQLSALYNILFYYNRWKNAKEMKKK